MRERDVEEGVKEEKGMSIGWVFIFVIGGIFLFGGAIIGSLKAIG